MVKLPYALSTITTTMVICNILKDLIATPKTKLMEFLTVDTFARYLYPPNSEGSAPLHQYHFRLLPVCGILRLMPSGHLLPEQSYHIGYKWLYQSFNHDIL
jgi:hypothetical protein